MENLDKIYALVEEKADKMERNAGYSLGDIHEGNMLVTIDDDNNVENLVFIDFADAYTIDKSSEYGRTFESFKIFIRDFIKYKLKKYKLKN